MIVHFKNVGRNKLNWELEVPDYTRAEIFEAMVLKSIKQSRAIMSSDIQFEIYEDGSGVIAAGMRNVGEIEVRNTPAEVKS